MTQGGAGGPPQALRRTAPPQRGADCEDYVACDNVFAVFANQQEELQSDMIKLMTGRASMTELDTMFRDVFDAMLDDKSKSSPKNIKSFLLMSAPLQLKILGSERYISQAWK